MQVQTNLQTIALAEVEKEEENFRFRTFLKAEDHTTLDQLVLTINNTITPQIDCTACGNCCNTLMINVTEVECTRVSKHLQQNIETFKKNYIETSEQGAMIMNTIPCNFLKEKKCTIYENRFTECREFPHLHKPNFKERLFGTMMHYGRCPIIYNVIETLKKELAFIPK